jgi:hypothetical protein
MGGSIIISAQSDHNFGVRLDRNLMLGVRGSKCASLVFSQHERADQNLLLPYSSICSCDRYCTCCLTF